MLYADLLSLHLVTFLMIFILVEATTVSETTQMTELENTEEHLDILLEQPEVDTEAEECSTSEERLPIFKTKLAPPSTYNL